MSAVGNGVDNFRFIFRQYIVCLDKAHMVRAAGILTLASRCSSIQKDNEIWGLIYMEMG